MEGDTIMEARQFIEHFNKFGPNQMARFLLDHGHTYEATTGQYEQGTAKECYRNAALLAQSHPDLTYVEGWAIGIHGLPFEHAWVVDRHGAAHEVTWDEAGPSYFGVPFTTDGLWRWLVETERYGLLGNFYLVDEPFERLRGIVAPKPAYAHG